MRRIAWKAVPEELASVPGKDEALDRPPEGMNAPGKVTLEIEFENTGCAMSEHHH